MSYRLIHRHQHSAEPTPLAEHVDPVVLKQHGYESARSLGDEHALWSRSAQPGILFELRCRGGHALLIERHATH